MLDNNYILFDSPDPETPFIGIIILDGPLQGTHYFNSEEERDLFIKENSPLSN
jgi:hypothetical protein